MRFIELFQKTMERLAEIFFIGSAIATFGLLLLIFTDMASRNLIGFSIEGAIEISEYSLVAIGFLGLAYAQLKGAHVNVDFLLLCLSARAQRIVNVFILLILIVFFVTMSLQIGKETYISWIRMEYRSGTTLLIPTWPPQFVAFLGTVALVLAFISQLSGTIAGFKKKGSLTEGR